MPGRAGSPWGVLREVCWQRIPRPGAWYPLPTHLPEDPMAYKIGYTAALGWRDRPAREVAAQLRSIGCESVEWPGHRFDPRARTAAEMAAVVRDTAAEGLEISSVAFHRDLIGADTETRRDKVAHIAELIRAVAGQGIPRGNIWTGPAAWAAGEPRLGKDLTEGAAWD